MTMDIESKYPGKIKGIFSTFDRMIFKGHYTPFFIENNRYFYLSRTNVPLKNFKKYAKSISEKIHECGKITASKTGRVYEYLPSPKISKEKKAKEIMKRDNIKEGLICVLATVELCRTFSVRGNPKTHKLEIEDQDRKGLYLYYFYNDKEYGFMHVRIQTWFPFEIQIYINGREHLSKQFDKRNIDYERYENTFLDISDMKKAKKLARRFEQKDFQKVFDKIANRVNPHLPVLKKIFNTGYYWCFHQCEYATDVMFENRRILQEIYPDMVKHMLTCYNSSDVMNFLGRKLHGNFQGEVTSDIKKRPEGVRIKHRMKKNSIKMYDKYSVLRVEVTINQPKEFKIYRTVNRKGEEVKAWVPMGKGIANIYRYIEICQSANNRYLQAVSTVREKSDFKTLSKVSKKVQKNNNNSFSGLNLLSPETIEIFKSVMDGNHLINGFRNKDIRKLLYPKYKKDNLKKLSSKTTRLLRKLKAHGLIYKVSRSSRYQITSKGYKIMGFSLKVSNNVSLVQAA